MCLGLDGEVSAPVFAAEVATLAGLERESVGCDGELFRFYVRQTYSWKFGSGRLGYEGLLFRL